jgi:hypothetical protein
MNMLNAPGKSGAFFVNLAKEPGLIGVGMYNQVDGKQ